MGQISILSLSNLTQLVKPVDVLQLKPVQPQPKPVQDAPAITVVDPNAPAPATAVEATVAATGGQLPPSAWPLVIALQLTSQ